MSDEKWFHPKDKIPSRECADQVLRKHGMEEGLFLVRESSTADGDFVLSVSMIRNN
jgi:tyrosine-protein kinase